MVITDESRIYNTFDAHRLLHWAEATGGQKVLKEALFALYFTDRGDSSNHEDLIGTVERAGLPAAEARVVLASNQFAEDVRQQERLWQLRGIHAVPAVVINERYLVSGGQPPETFEQALRSIAAKIVAAT